MRLHRADIVVLLAAALVVFLVTLLPSPRDRNPPVPNTPDHGALKSERDCVRCHAAGGGRPLSSRHPTRQDCYRCHRNAEEFGE